MKRKNPSRGAPADSTAAQELTLFAENDGDLYRQMRKPIELNLLKKYVKGTYNSELAVVAWTHFADAAARKYAKEFATPQEWNAIFSPATRKLAARYMAGTWEQELPSAAKFLNTVQSKTKQHGYTIGQPGDKAHYSEGTVSMHSGKRK